MVNDSVREELAPKIGRGSGPLEKKTTDSPASISDNGNAPATKQPIETSPAQAPAPARSKTNFLAPRPTSKTLVEFQPKAASLPEWRLQVQNAVRKRNGVDTSEAERPAEVQLAKLPPPATLEQRPAVETAHAASPANPMLAKALQRIETSRQTYMPGAAGAAAVARKPIAARPFPAPPPVQKTYPFDLVPGKATATPAKREAEPASVPAAAPAKPRLVSSLRIEKKKYDTNKLPPIPQPAELSSSFESLPAAPALAVAAAAAHTTFIPESSAELSPDELEMSRAFETNEEPEIFDDIPPFGMRFAAGLFDVLASGFGTLVILSPLIFGQNAAYTLSLGIGFAAVLAAFLFLYLTASLAFRGKTLGMWMFSLELIDAEQNAYPNAHQAAVHSAVYVLSLALFGLGFVTIIFDEEKRAVHDIISGTLLVKQT
ncbi:MAG: RDD family protein [Acidobacteria bacterium]|nr:RDD family protein [Acidobacteriota bacterium]